MVDNIKRLAKREHDAAIRDEIRRSLNIVELPDGRILGMCRTCPKKTRDHRNASHAFSSGHAAESSEEVYEWFIAHRLTDMHAYYRDDPPTAAISDEERVLHKIFGGREPRPTVVPFKFAQRYR